MNLQAGIFGVFVALAGCGAPQVKAEGIPMDGTWNIESPEAGKQGVNSQITYRASDYQMKMSITTQNGENATITIKGTYSKTGGKLTMKAESVDVDSSQLSEASKQQYAQMFDKAAILTNANKNPEMNVRFEGDFMIAKVSNGTEMKLKRVP